MRSARFYINTNLFALLVLCLLSGNIKAQEVTASATMDSTNIFIGGQVDLKLTVNQPQGVIVTIPQFTDTIAKSVEIVESGRVDTIPVGNNRIQLNQLFRITSFDSGLHYIAPIEFEIIEAENKKIITTEPMALRVINPFTEVDPQKGITDIKQPHNTPFSFAELLQYYPYLIALIVLILIIVGIVIWRQSKKGAIKILKKTKPLEPPHVIAIRALDTLKGEKLWQKELTKKYYTKLTEILREYIETRFGVPALEQTTHELMQSLTSIEISDAKSVENLKKILELADLVKFAKFSPLPDENDLCMINAYFFINQTKIEVMKTLEEEKKDMLAKEADENQPSATMLNQDAKKD